VALLAPVGGVLASDANSLIWWGWVGRHLPLIGSALVQHLVLTGTALGLGLVISLPLALLARRYRWTQAPILTASGLLYTVPSLALFFLLGPFTGYASRTTAVIALTSYTLLILIRNVVAGLDGVPAEVIEAARGMGYAPLRLLLTVELPLALPAIVAGIRIATVTTIGLVNVAAIIGQPGLGALITDGLRRSFPTPLMVGAILAIALAVLADLLIAGAQRLVTPWRPR
jgi:osmoprotectant transport system permease protein